MLTPNAASISDNACSYCRSNSRSYLKDYRQALAARYGELETMPYTRLLKLERCPHWKGNIEYTVTITKTFPDKTEIKELREVYPGKERRKAIARYEQLKKERPGIEAVMDIEKRQWEK